VIQDITLDGPPNAITSDDGRTYVHPITGERFVSVTTALSIVAKPYLTRWYGKLSACEVLDNYSRLKELSRIPICEDEKCGSCIPCWIKWVSLAGNRERDAAGDCGSRVHHVAEHFALGGMILPHRPDVAPYIRQYLRFVERYEPSYECAEITVLNREHGWAGTLDGVARFGWMPKRLRHLVGLPLLLDYKTNRHVDYLAGYQVAAYRHGERVMLADGTELEMPEMHAETALSVQIRPRDYWVRAVDVTAGTYAKFIRVLGVWRDCQNTKGIMGYAVRKDAH